MIRQLLELYTLVLIADIVLSYLPQLKDHIIVRYVKKAADVTCGPARLLLSKITPPDFQIDLAPLLVIVAINILERFLVI